MKKVLIACQTSVLLHLISCVTPFYGTARVEKGFHMDAGVSAMSYIGAYGEWNAPSVGGVASIAPSYGFNPYLQLGGRLGLGYGQTGFIVHDTAGNPHNPWGFFPDIALNLQAALPTKSITPALRIEGTLPRILSATFLLGIGEKERITLGVRGGLTGFDILAILRPLPKLGLFIGVNPFFLLNTPRPVASLGIGYKFF